STCGRPRTTASGAPAAGRAASSRSHPQPVARTADGREQFWFEPNVDLGAQSAYQDLQHVRERIVIVVPDVRGDRAAIDDVPGVTQQEFEQRKLFRGQGNGSARA